MAAGDVVNTAARLQAAAPLNGVLVGEQTYRATAHAIDYREAEPVVGKGKSEPIRAWEALQARSRFGVDVSQRADAPLVGRGRELDLLVSTLGRVREERSPQLVTLVGVPGIGKSRLVSELLRAVEEGAELVRWRQGRSLPYGDGVTFWALAEIVKAEAGILESDTAEQAGEKLARAVGQSGVEASEAQWVERHLRPLAGSAEAGLASAGGGRSPPGAVTSRRWPSSGRLVLVFEDLHWADDATARLRRPARRARRRRPAARARHRAPRALATPARMGRRQAERARRSRCRRSPTDETGRLAPVAARAAGARRADAGRAARPRRRQPALRRAVRAEPARAGRASSRCRRPCRESSPPGSTRFRRRRSGCCRTRRSSARSSGSGAVEAVDGVTRWQAEELLHALERKEFVQRSRTLVGCEPRASTRSATCSSATSPTARSRVRRDRRSISARPRGSSRSDGPRSRPRCSPTTTCRRSSWRRRPGSMRPRWTSRPGMRCATPATGPRRSTRPRRRSASTTPRFGCGRRTIRSGPSSSTADPCLAGRERRRRSRAAGGGPGCPARRRRQREGRRGGDAHLDQRSGCRAGASLPMSMPSARWLYSPTRRRVDRSSGSSRGWRAEPRSRGQHERALELATQARALAEQLGWEARPERGARACSGWHG